MVQELICSFQARNSPIVQKFSVARTSQGHALYSSSSSFGNSIHVQGWEIGSAALELNEKTTALKRKEVSTSSRNWNQMQIPGNQFSLQLKATSSTIGPKVKIEEKSKLKAIRTSQWKSIEAAFKITNSKWEQHKFLEINLKELEIN